jgi:hypothetical protein
MKKCPPGVFCIENMTFVILFIIVFVLFYFIYMNLVSQQKVEKKVNQQLKHINSEMDYTSFTYPPKQPFYRETDTLLDPYAAPLSDERYVLGPLIPPPLNVPINIPTNIGFINASYRQMGILTPLNGPKNDRILPLMGRPLYSSRQKWQYYTISNQHNNVKLPIIVKGRSATSDVGVDELYDGDRVFVEGNREKYVVKIYDNDTVSYLPFI